MFARIEEISPDFKRGWYIVKLLKWQVPLQVVSWILRDAYIDGSEFIMNGKRIRLGKVVCPLDAVEPVDEEGPEPKKAPAEPKVISLADLKKTPT